MIVDICGCEYKIIPFKQEITINGIVFGQCDYQNEEIKINTDQTENQKKITLLHEIIHAIDDNFQLELSENQVQILATSINQVLKSNNLDNIVTNII